MKHPVVPLALLALAAQASAAPCPAERAGLKGLLEAEYSFAQAARSSLRQAFLDNLSEASWVLEPTPVPGKPWYRGVPDSDARLEWYPQAADISGSQDLGFSSGPWTYTKDAARASGHFLTLWHLEADCRWRVVFDGGISHARPEASEPALRPDEALVQPAQPPPVEGGGEMHGFETVAGREGLSAALRTYARNGTFLLLAEGALPMDLDRAERLNRKRRIKGPWRESARGQSQDGSLSYVLGQVESGSYVEIWQYDPKVANWGLRVLMLTGS